jgi:hypothetical protein
MRRFFLGAVALAAVLSFTSAVQAQVVVGGSGAATMMISGGHVVNTGSAIGEIEYQFPWADAEESRHWGALVGYLGVASEGGGEQMGLGYRHYIRTGTVYPGFGFGAFTLGTHTPLVDELSIFVGPEIILEVPMSEEDGDIVTGFVGVYPVVAGVDGVMVIRAGIRAALN